MVGEETGKAKSGNRLWLRLLVMGCTWITKGRFFNFIQAQIPPRPLKSGYLQNSLQLTVLSNQGSAPLAWGGEKGRVRNRQPVFWKPQVHRLPWHKVTTWSGHCCDHLGSRRLSQRPGPGFHPPGSFLYAESIVSNLLKGILMGSQKTATLWKHCWWGVWWASWAELPGSLISLLAPCYEVSEVNTHLSVNYWFVDLWSSCFLN